ncbi:PAS domain S-box protein [Spirulina subsalsa FACHB-351]|uniref:histidine kinase n=1 Tax=Spirulina subsalsa FACHB-351 TaxID=234711 RepID=A0ABT3L1D9_9CYAN|nr:PAS domain S-box protein [Spirulina subsalsa]MCW6035280.1 PAS domain S-box protein [Spirulina subsalsa FACHB-351]
MFESLPLTLDQFLSTFPSHLFWIDWSEREIRPLPQTANQPDSEHFSLLLEAFEQQPEFWQIVEQVITQQHPQPFSYSLPNQTHFSAQISPCTPQNVLWVAQEVTALQQPSPPPSPPSESFEQLVVTLLNSFVHLQDPSELDQTIQKALTQILQYTGFDRSFIMLFSEDGQDGHLAYEACRPGVPSATPRRNLPTEPFTWWMEKMYRQEIIEISNLDQLPPQATPERIALESAGIHSLVVVPLISRQETLWGARYTLGYVGFSSFEREQTWSSQTVSLLRLVGDLFAQTLERYSTVTALQNTEQRFHAIFEQTFQFMSLLTTEGVILEANASFLDWAEQTAVEGRMLWSMQIFQNAQVTLCPSSPITSDQDSAERETRGDCPLTLNYCPLSQSTEGSPACWQGDANVSIDQQLQLAIQQAAGGQLVRCALKVRPRFQDPLTASPESVGLTPSVYLASILYKQGQAWDYQERIFDFSLKPVRDHGGEVQFLIVEGHDITDHYRAVEQIRFQANLLDVVEQAVIVTDFDGKICYWNRHAEKLYGWSVEEVLGRSLFETVADTNAQEVGREIMVNLERGESWSGEFWVRHKDGFTFPAWVMDSPIADDQGNLVGVIGISTDITERLEAAAALQQSEELFRVTFEQSPIGMLVRPLDGGPNRPNQALAKLLGYSLEELEHITYHDYTHPEDLPLDIVLDEQLVRGEISDFHLEKRYICKDGQVVYTLLHCALVRDAEGRPHYVIGQVVNITERKEKETALQQSEERWQLALRGTHDGIWDWNVRSGEVFYSDRLLTMLGYEPGDWEKTLEAWTERIHPADYGMVMQALEEHLVQKTPYYITEHRVRCQNGEYLWILDRGQALWDEEGEAVRVVGSHTDIGDRKRSEVALQRANRALKTLSDCNQALVHADTEEALFQQICEIMVTVGGYRLAWVGYPEYDSAQSVRVVAQAGWEAGYLDQLQITWADRERGRGPTGIAIRTGKPAVLQNILTDPHYAPWREEARKRGYRSSIAIPLNQSYQNLGHWVQENSKGEEKEDTIAGSFPPPLPLTPAMGVLNLYSTEPEAFDEAEVQLLCELANDLSYGIMALRTHRAQIESEEKFRQLAENIEDVFWMSRIDGTQMLYVSPAYEQIWGRSRRELYQNPQAFFAAIHPEDKHRAISTIRNPQNLRFDLEYRIVRPDGSMRWVWDRGFPIVDRDSRKVYRRAGIAKDITERKQAEQMLHYAKEELELRVAYRTVELETANERLQNELMQRHRTEMKLRKSEEQYRTLVRNFPKGAVFLFNQDLRYTIADGVGLATQGLSREQLEDRTIWEVLPPDLCRDLEPLYYAALAGETRSAEIEYQGRLYLYQALPVRNKQGERFAGMIVMQDITERQQAEAERNQLIAIIEATPDFISSVTPEGEIVYMNQSARQILGVPSDESLWDADETPPHPLPWGKGEGGKTKRSFHSQRLSSAYPQWADHLIRSEGIPTAIREGTWIGETAILSHDGQEIPLSQLIIAHRSLREGERMGTVQLLSTIARDISEQKRSEATLRESERRWRSFLENIPLLVVNLTPRGKVDYVNPYLLKVTGYNKAEVMGQDWFEFFLPAAQRQSTHHHFEAMLHDAGQARYEESLLTKFGEERRIAWNNTVLRDSQGHVVGTLSIGEDITERYAVERMKDEFISVVSHELRTPLTSIHGALNLLASGLVDCKSQRGDRVIQIAAESAERLVRLVNDILELERLESGKIKLITQQVNSADLLIRATEQMQVMATRSGIRLEAEIRAIEFEADADRVIQVLTNLLSNAIKFSEADSTIWLSVQALSYDANNPLDLQRQDPARVLADSLTSDSVACVVFSVRDQGRGIPADKIESIFERFHQVDASDSRKKGGTGLGLAICRSIVEQHGGQIWVQSRVGEGSCFFFTIPIIKNH